MTVIIKIVDNILLVAGRHTSFCLKRFAKFPCFAASPSMMLTGRLVDQQLSQNQIAYANRTEYSNEFNFYHFSESIANFLFLYHFCYLIHCTVI